MKTEGGYGTNGLKIMGKLDNLYYGLMDKRTFLTDNIFAWVAYFNGIYPVQNKLTRGTEKPPLKFKWISFPVIYSVIMYFFKILAVINLFELSNQFNVSGKQKMIDVVAGGISFFLTFCSGMLIHILCILVTPGTLRVFNSIGDYNEKYAAAYDRGVVSSKVKINNGVGFFIVFAAPSLIMWNILTSGKEYLVLSCPFHRALYRTSNPILVYAFFVLAGLVVEYAVLYLYGEIFVVSGIMDRRLDMLKETVEDISGLTPQPERPEQRGRVSIAPDPSKSGKGGTGAWARLGRQYLDFHNMFELCEKELMPVIICLLGGLVLATVSTVFYRMNSQTPFSRDVPMVLVGAIAFSVYRIYALADCGENIWRKYQCLRWTLLRVKHEVHLLPNEKAQYERVLRLVKTLPVILSASGFFTLNRRCATSVLSVIITYIVVLLQFRITDESQIALQTYNVTAP